MAASTTSKQPVELTVDEYAGLQVTLNDLKRRTEEIEGKVDHLSDTINERMTNEEKTKKKIMWILVSIAVGIILNTLGVPVADWISVLKVVGG